MITKKKGAAVLAALLLAAAPAAAAWMSCGCAPCPLELPAPCRSEEDLPCCGEPEEAPACACAHLETPAALPSGYDTPIPPCTTAVEPPLHESPCPSAVPAALRPPGHDPPSGVALFLLNVDLRL